MAETMAVDEGVREEEEGVREEDDPAAVLWLPVVQQLNQMQHSDNRVLCHKIILYSNNFSHVL